MPKNTKADTLTPEEQVNLHLAMRGNGTDIDSLPDREPSDYVFYEDDFRRFLDSGKASVSFAELSPELFTRNDFFFDEADKPYRGWKLDKVTFTDGSCSPETIMLEFARFCGEKEERLTKPLTDLPDDDLIRVDDLVEEVDDYLTGMDGITEESDDDDDEYGRYSEYGDYDEYITDLDDKPVFGALEYVQSTHEIIGRKIKEAYDEIACMADELELDDGGENFGTIVPIDTVYDTLADADRRNPEVYEYVAVSRLRESGYMVVFGHKYSERNSRRRKTEQVMPLDGASVGAVIGILKRMEEYFFDDDEEEA